MSDLISRQEAFDEIIWNSDNGVIDAKVAIEALRKLPSVEPEPCEDCISRADAFNALRIKGDYNTLNEVYERLEKLPSVTPKWIPVSDKVPECDGYYLTSTVYGEVYCDYWSDDHFNRTETVLAWVPLPEPYKAESEG